MRNCSDIRLNSKNDRAAKVLRNDCRRGERRYFTVVIVSKLSCIIVVGIQTLIAVATVNKQNNVHTCSTFI